MDICLKINAVMKRNLQLSKTKGRTSRMETPPLLRGMFICPEPVRRLKNVSGADILRDFFKHGDHPVPGYACE